MTHCNEAVNKNHIDVWDILRDELTVHLYLSLLCYLLETVPVSVLSPLCYHMIAEMVTNAETHRMHAIRLLSTLSTSRPRNYGHHYANATPIFIFLW